MKIYLGADHGGYELKIALREHLASAGYDVEDVGAKSLDPDDDYPRYAYDVAAKVLGGEDDLGILICRSGQGMAIAANRVRGIRAAIAWSPETAAHGRKDDNVNVLVLAADYTDEQTSFAAAEAFLKTEFSKNPRYQRRLDQIEELYG